MLHKKQDMWEASGGKSRINRYINPVGQRGFTNHSKKGRFIVGEANFKL